MSFASTQRWTDALRWALESEANPALAAADWLARDIDPMQESAIALLTQPNVPLAHLEQAKDVYKTMRILGETTADRRTGGRLYLAAIAAALSMHGARITRQSTRALQRALRTMLDDPESPEELKMLAGRALLVLGGGGVRDGGK